jgi:hypothetical protein
MPSSQWRSKGRDIDAGNLRRFVDILIEYWPKEAAPPIHRMLGRGRDISHISLPSAHVLQYSLSLSPQVEDCLLVLRNFPRNLALSCVTSSFLHECHRIVVGNRRGNLHLQQSRATKLLQSRNTMPSPTPQV